ncbi:MAG: addiction module family protein [Bergeyella sp.]
MEATVDIKKRIHEFVDRADDRILNIINAIISTEESDEPTKAQLLEELRQSAKEIQMVEQGKLKARPIKELLDEL